MIHKTKQNRAAGKKAASPVDKTVRATTSVDRAPDPAEGANSDPDILTLVKDSQGRTMLQLRSRLRLSREMFVRLLPVSTRTLASIESGQTPSEAVQRRLTEIGRIVAALSEVLHNEAIGPWLNQPNDAFHGLKPIEVIERGEADRIWRMICLLRSGAAF